MKNNYAANAAIALATLCPVTFAQQPSQVDYSRLILTTTVERSDATVWTGSLKCRVSFIGGASNSYGTATTNPQGQVVFDMRVVTTDVTSYKASIEFWRGDDGEYRGAQDSYFLDPTEGQAAFLPPIQLQVNDATGYFEYDSKAIMSAPPLYGTLTLTDAPQQGSQLLIGDFVESTALQVQRMKRDVRRQEWPHGAVTVPIYRWSRAGASSVLMLGPKGTITLNDAVRRGGVLETSVKRENRIRVIVDQLAHPVGYSAFIVRATDHDPNVQPDLPASRSMFYAQRNRSIGRRKLSYVGGSDTFDTYVSDDSFVVELWSRTRDPVSGNWLYSLAAFEPVPTTQQDHVINLN
jgi:hypothetical protein